MTTEDTTFFAAVASAAAALVGLSFIALSFFLVDILKRYDLTALPVFRHRDRTQTRRVAHHWHPKQLTDRELLDGDPLVVFMAFSVAVTWNLFLMPLTIALTAAGGGGLPVLASEMTAFFGLFWFSFKVRNQKIDELRPYLTREELLWRPLGAIALSIYLVATLLVGLTALFSQGLPIGRLASTWRSWDPTSPRTAIRVASAISRSRSS